VPAHRGFVLGRFSYARRHPKTFTNPDLAPFTDPYFRGFDNTIADYYREQEWSREFTNYVRHHDLPSLELVRLMHDHTGNFTTAQNGVNTPGLQIADNDYAVGKLIQTVAHSPYASSTLIFIVEDDAQDGPDHVDGHRSEAFVVDPSLDVDQYLGVARDAGWHVEYVPDAIVKYDVVDGWSSVRSDFERTRIEQNHSHRDNWKWDGLSKATAVKGLLAAARKKPNWAVYWIAVQVRLFYCVITGEVVSGSQKFDKWG
jgi:hypothetical protein